MEKIIFIISMCTCFVLWNCQDVTIGFLYTEAAEYSVDSLVVKRELTDVAPGETKPNPEYYELLDMGIPPDMIAMLDIYPTITVGRGEDYLRELNDIPWVSYPIEGIEGTKPIFVHVKSVKSIEGEGADVLESVLTVRGDGTIEVPAHHGVPIGRYLVSLTFRNEGYTKDVDDCFTVIVK